MGHETKLLSFIFVALLLILSYGHVTDSVQDAADADPTHTGKAFLAQVLPYFWLMFIILSVGVIAVVVFEEIT
ncbi:unnamed protein product [marine sediment metagenome]|uniref:Uncharacterized protein n=1 Tax=marine sediment metagenome TaxID=412755 RepID=X1BDC4_9ZZZZ